MSLSRRKARKAGGKEWTVSAVKEKGAALG